MMTFAKQIGKALAYLQDTIDVFVSWGFKKIRTSVKTTKEKHPLKKGIKAGLGFLAQIGETFYQEYEALKKRNKK